MKTQKSKRGIILLLFSLYVQFSFALTGGSIMGQVTDPETKNPVSDAAVVLDCQGTQKVFMTNENGFYYASNISSGVYSIKVSFMSKVSEPIVVKVGDDETKEVNILFSVYLNIGTVIVESDPIVDALNPTSSKIPRVVFEKMPIQKVTDLNEIIGGAIKIGNNYYVHGARAGGVSYYIDGCKVMGTPNIPLCGLDTYQNYTGFIPAKYGDATGGVIVMETRNFFGEQNDF